MTHEPFRALARMARTVAATPEMPVPSPCISVCRINAASGRCDGCVRTLDEIAAWSGLDDAGKRGIWARIERRVTERPA